MSASAARPVSNTHRDLNVPLSPLKAPLRSRASAADSLIDRVRGEFVEMRGFSPTLTQAVRLFNLSEGECRTVLTTLVSEGFLLQSSDGRYRLSRHR